LRHYHELTELAEQRGRAQPAGGGERIRRPHYFCAGEPGKANRSYGIEVARLAGLPRGVIQRARAVLKRHEKTEHVVTEELTPRGTSAPVQIRLFEPVDHNIAERIRELKLDELRPIEALQLLAELQEELKRSCV
jgi:DNA mismatch repair protein MutS